MRDRKGRACGRASVEKKKEKKLRGRKRLQTIYNAKKPWRKRDKAARELTKGLVDTI